MTKRLIIKNAKIFTANLNNPWATAAAIRDGIFEKVGELHEMVPFSEPDTEVVNLQGRLVLPGLIDAHTHVGLSVMMGDDDDSMPMWDCKSREEILQALKEHVKAHPFRLYYAAFFGQIEALGKEKLTKEELDRIVKRPVFLLEQECHSAWLNSAALRILKIQEDAEDPAPGYSYYERDEKGRLTGCIKEMTMLPLLEISGNTGRKKMKEGVTRIFDYLLERGVTAIYDAGNYFNEEKTYQIFAEMDREGKLPIHIEGSYIITRPAMADSAVTELKRYKELYETENLKFNTVKIMFDGTHRIHTAKLVEPYADTGGTGGTMLTEERLYLLLKELNEEGIDFHAHTVGEGASKMVLDCVERLKKEGEFNIIVTLAHLESQRDEDIPRFAELGVTGNFTPHWHGGNDYGTMEETAALLGERRAKNLFRAKTMMRSGAVVTFSSDEVTLQLLDRWNPFLGIETGHTRQEVTDGGKNAPVFPPEEERLSIEEMILGYTINAAYALRLDDRIGSIEEGKRANLVVLGQDLFEIDPYEIHNVKPEAVMVGGKVVRGKL